MPPKSPKRRRSGTSTTEANPAAYPNHVWSYDFVADQTTDGKTLRFLTMIVEYTRRGLWIECARHLTSVAVVRVLERLVQLHGISTMIKSDNDPEFVATKVPDGQAKSLTPRLDRFLGLASPISVPICQEFCETQAPHRRRGCIASSYDKPTCRGGTDAYTGDLKRPPLSGECPSRAKPMSPTTNRRPLSGSGRLVTFTVALPNSTTIGVEKSLAE